MTKRLLIAGGIQDPNLIALEAAARRLGVDVINLRSSPTHAPGVLWDLDLDRLVVDGVDVQADAMFYRHDVFGQLAGQGGARESQRAYAWSTLVQSWGYAHPDVRQFNASIRPEAGIKPVALQWARQEGFHTAYTWISNTGPMLSGFDGDAWISKPVGGGDHCITLAEACKLHRIGPLHDAPSLLQPRLRGQEWRLFQIGDQHFAFEVNSPSLDYRVHQDAQLVCCEPPPMFIEPMRRLMKRFGMSFGAADLKLEHDAPMGEGNPAYFLELNTSPMFARFDALSDGRLTDAMVRTLVDETVG